MRIDVSSNMRAVLEWTAELGRQLPFAVAKSLTETARDVQLSTPKLLQQELDKPSPFTESGTYLKPARKDNLESEVGFKPRQAGYLWWQVEGGSREPDNKALRLPSVVQLNQYGNVPAGLIRQLIARARAGRRATKRQAERFGVSQQLDLFYGEPGDGRPAGIYKRVAISATKHQLVPIIVFPQQPARYERRLDFYGNSTRVAVRVFEAHLERNWQLALATAR